MECKHGISGGVHLYILGCHPLLPLRTSSIVFANYPTESAGDFVYASNVAEKLKSSRQAQYFRDEDISITERTEKNVVCKTISPELISERYHRKAPTADEGSRHCCIQLVSRSRCSPSHEEDLGTDQKHLFLAVSGMHPAPRLFVR